MSQINVVVIDEFEDEDLTQQACGKLDLDSGFISEIERNKNHHTKPWKAKDYSFTMGILKLGKKELEFAINVDKNEQYHVLPQELVEIKEKLCQLSQTKGKKMRM